MYSFFIVRGIDFLLSAIKLNFTLLSRSPIVFVVFLLLVKGFQIGDPLL